MGKKEKPQTKICKHCKSEIPFEAKVCPQCRKKQGMGCIVWAIIIIVAIGVIGALAGGGGDDSKPKKTGEVKTEDKKDDNKESGTEEEVSNIFHAGDIVVTEDLKIKFVSAAPYQEET